MDWKTASGRSGWSIERKTNFVLTSNDFGEIENVARACQRHAIERIKEEISLAVKLFKDFARKRETNYSRLWRKRKLFWYLMILWLWGSLTRRKIWKHSKTIENNATEECNIIIDKSTTFRIRHHHMNGDAFSWLCVEASLQ